MKKFSYVLLLWVLLAPLPVFSADLVFMVLDQNSYIAHLAVKDLAVSENLKKGVRVITASDITRDTEGVKQVVDRTSLIVVDVMGRELTGFLGENMALSSKTIYALRGSLDNDSLKKKGFLFDPEILEYYRHVSVENVKNMLKRIINRHIDKSVGYDPVKQHPRLGIYHPDADREIPSLKNPGIFTDITEYLQWQSAREGFDADRPVIGFFFFSSFLTKGQQEPVDTIIRRLEAEGFNVIPCFGREKDIIKNYMLDQQGRGRVNMVLAFSFKFYNAMTPELCALLKKLDVPVFSAVSVYKDTIEQWRKSPLGIDALEVAWSIAVPEISGLIEPTVLAAKEKILDQATGKTFFVGRQVSENMDRLVPRLKKWMVLQSKPNKDKKIAVMFYNHHQGKQNVGASYLNVFKSIEHIFFSLEKKGYTTGKPLSEMEIKELILSAARNIGSWAPGELDKMLAGGKIIRLPLDQYKRWFETLPENFRKNVLAQWGEPESSGIMIKGNDFIIPGIQVANFLLLPEPSRGWGDDPMKLYHDTTLYPHHQYLAVYLWLSRVFKADAMIHLGTHATYEWTPGKQAGLSPSCPPEVLITDIPNLYPYIVDDVGEGIQAKRRGRGLIIDHLTPVLKKADISGEYSRMAELVNEIERAEKRGSITAAEKTKELMAIAGSTGILVDLKESRQSRHKTDFSTKAAPHKGHSHQDSPETSRPAGDPAAMPAGQQNTEETIHLLGHYLEDIKSSLIPYGMHTFGRSPQPEALGEMTAAIEKYNPEILSGQLSENLAACGSTEMNSLTAGLEGRYVHPGKGNDPVRNPGALPTGRNFYGFNPGKLPSPAAWELGKKAAWQIIDNHKIKNGTWPQKVAVVLWAVETLRSEGVNEATIMYLVGTRPKWSKSGRVLGIEVISGKELNRPRIDVMINPSGLYRDLFPEKMLYLDQAIRMAVKQTDVENFIARHNAQIKTRLISQSMAPEKADEMSRFRIFCEPPGAYGNGVSEMASGSSKWDDSDKVVDVYENRTGYAFGQGKNGRQWGLAAKESMKTQLSQVDVAVHSSSSNVYGLLDNDDMFQYLGGLSMAIRKESGKAPETLITRQQQKGRVNVEDMGKTLGREMRARYLNPKWIKGMKAEDYAGAKAMADFVEYLWGWNMTTPEKVDAAKWQQTFEVYVEDKYGLELKDFFEKASPWAFQSITARMLETHRKGYWKADEKQLETLAAEYAKSVIAKGIACCDHTCNNPMLNQMVVSIVSMPGVLAPELVKQFKLAVEQASQKPLDQQVEERKKLIEELAAPGPEPARPESKTSGDVDAPDKDMVEGYKMEKIETKDDTTEMTSSGIEWLAVLSVLGIIGLVTFGARKQ